MHKMNLQLFGENENEEVAKVEPAAKPTNGKVFSEEYVVALREEAKSHRLAKKQYESIIRKAFELSDDEPITNDLSDRFKKQIEQKTADAIQQANQKIITAEIKALEGYDVKLVKRLLDQSKLVVKDDGTVEGLQEAVDEIAKEFPQVKTQKKEPSGDAPNPPQDSQSTLERVKDQLAKATSLEEKIALKEQIFKLENQKGG